ncbi:DUF4328 domain-containing protein [Kitasatospora sp. NPDC092948]|uniref:DUF4328 domain-containing protein n=1 Tax=Kitasatospora sp. NPDC092948 TaxID=3364088 RepID=UPI0038287791
MHPESTYDQPRPQGLPDDGRLAGFRRLALAAQVLIGVQTVWNLVLGAAGGTRSTLFRLSAPLTLVLFVAPIVVFLLWFRRCRLNADHLAPEGLQDSAGWAVGAWFVPVVMWWIPRRIALDIRRVSAPTSSPWLINAWWAAWLAMTLGAALLPVLGVKSTGYSPYNLVPGLAAAVLAILVIQQLTSHQDARLRALAQPAQHSALGS